LGFEKLGRFMFSRQQSLRIRQAGFTLIEIMVVVVIVAILSSAVVPMMTKNANDILEEQADRFVALVKLAQDEAILQSRQLGLKVDEQGYSFLQRSDDGDNWFPFTEGPFRSRTLSSGIKSALYVEDVDVFLAKESLDEEGNKKVKPQVFLLSSGEMTPFSYEFSFTKGSRIKLIFDAIGNNKKEIVDSLK
jgi:general secretion pathway protein H